MRSNGLRRLSAGFLFLVLLGGAIAGSLLAAAAESYLGKTVTVERKDRPSITGQVLEHVSGKSLKLQVGAAAVEIDLAEPGVRVKVVKSPREQFEEQAAKAKTADDWVKLARWCSSPEVRLSDERRRALDEAIKLDPNHQEARDLRGDIKKADGSWVNEEDEKRAQGFVKGPEGKYITKKEADRLDEERRKKASGLGKREKELEGVPWASAPLLKGKHYVVKCNSTRDVAERYLKVLEAYYEAYSSVFRGFEPIYNDPGPIYIFRNRDEYMDFTLQSRDVGGFFHPLDKSVRTYHGSFSLTGNTDMILAHESTHQFQHRMMKDMLAVPFWIIEAMATYFGDGSKYTKAGKVELHQIAGDRLQLLQEWIQNGAYFKLHDLLRIRQGSPAVIRAYYEGWGLVYWLLDGYKYKVPPKGDGRKVWDQYLRHVALELKPPVDLDKEAKYLTDLIIKESGYKDIDSWENDYKSFILGLKLKVLGKWMGSKWDGWNEIGIQFTAPEKMKKVDDQGLRGAFREAAAATTDDGLRLWLSVTDSEEAPADEILRSRIRGLFTDTEFDEEFKEDEVKLVKVKTAVDAIEMAVTKLKGKFAQRRDTAVPEGEADKGAGGAKKNAAEKLRMQNYPDPTVMHSVRVALIASPDRIYLFGLAGPDGPFSKMEPRFDEVLASVKLNYEFH
jgi:hypothetical protein